VKSTGARPDLPKPLRFGPVFDDPEAVLACVRAGSPYRLQHVVDRTYAGDGYTPWFKAYWAVSGKALLPEAEALFRETRLLEAAAQCFDAEIIRPQSLMVNLLAPMTASAVHVDMPHFRGAPARTHAPALLYAMGRSGLFERWAIRIASALIWFHRGIGGAFEYWPESPERVSQLEAPPIWNAGLLADNERMLHRTQELGPPEAWLPRDLLRGSAQLHAADDGGWEIRDEGVPIWRYSAVQLRISILWKAVALADVEEAMVIDRGSDDLDPRRIEAVFAQHARQHGVALPPTEDPRTDPDWIRAVAALPPL
jgi:hypothetical protein